jgi:small-conductance mechanosensitive channel
MEIQDPGDILRFVRLAGLPAAVIVLLATWGFARLVTRFLEGAGNRFTDRRLLFQQIASFTRFFIYFSGFAVALLLSFRFSDQMLLALGGTAMVAIGIALKDIAASVLAGVVILIDRPFQVGDRISFGGFYGEVKHIGLRSVRLVTLDDNLVTIPNSRFMSEIVSSGNAGALDMMVVVDFHVDLYEDSARVRAILEDAIRTSPYVFLGKPWAIVTSQTPFEEFVALTFSAKVYVLDLQYEKALQTDLTERVLARFRQAGIRPAGEREGLVQRVTDATPPREEAPSVVQIPPGKQE